MTTHDTAWWRGRAAKRYRQAQDLHDRITAALKEHEDCWPDDPCMNLAADVRTALGKRP